MLVVEIACPITHHIPDTYAPNLKSPGWAVLFFVLQKNPAAVNIVVASFVHAALLSSPADSRLGAGFSVTAPIGSQFRMLRVHRPGCFLRADS